MTRHWPVIWRNTDPLGRFLFLWRACREDRACRMDSEKHCRLFLLLAALVSTHLLLVTQAQVDVPVVEVNVSRVAVSYTLRALEIPISPDSALNVIKTPVSWFRVPVNTSYYMRYKEGGDEEEVETREWMNHTAGLVLCPSDIGDGNAGCTKDGNITFEIDSPAGSVIIFQLMPSGVLTGGRIVPTAPSREQKIFLLCPGPLRPSTIVVSSTGHSWFRPNWSTDTNYHLTPYCQGLVGAQKVTYKFWCTADDVTYNSEAPSEHTESCTVDDADSCLLSGLYPAVKYDCWVSVMRGSKGGSHTPREVVWTRPLAPAEKIDAVVDFSETAISVSIPGSLFNTVAGQFPDDYIEIIVQKHGVPAPPGQADLSGPLCTEVSSTKVNSHVPGAYTVVARIRLVDEDASNGKFVVGDNTTVPADGTVYPNDPLVKGDIYSIYVARISQRDATQTGLGVPITFGCYQTVFQGKVVYTLPPIGLAMRIGGGPALTQLMVFMMVLPSIVLF